MQWRLLVSALTEQWTIRSAESTPQDLVDKVVDAEDTETQIETSPPSSEFWGTACLTAAECEARGYELGYDSFDAGPDLPIRGCFGKGDAVYFGIGGTAEQMSAAVPAGQERITCEAELEADAEALAETAADTATTAAPQQTDGPETEAATTAAPQQADGPQTEAPETTEDPTTTADPQQADAPPSEATTAATEQTDGPQTEAPLTQSQVLLSPIEEFEGTVCLTAAECEARGYELGYEFFDTGSNFPSKGCFGKGNVVYFGTGGTVEQMSAAVPSAQERITCVAEPEVVGTEAPETTVDTVTTTAPLTEAPTEAPTTKAPQVVIDATTEATTQTETSPLSALEETACLTAAECEARGDELNLLEFQSGDALPSKGCFSLRGKLYFGTGGTVEEMSSPELPGARTRVWCPTTSAPTAWPTTFLPTPEPTGKPTKEPTPSPTGSPIDWSQLTPGHTRFCGPKIVGGYEIAKSQCSPLTECGKGKGKDSAYGQSGNDCPKGLMCYTEIDCEAPSPTSYPSGSPGPTAAPSVTMSPSLSGAPSPETRDPTTEPTEPPSTSPVSPLAVNAVTVRGSFCGVTFERSVELCSSARSCVSDVECVGSAGEVCFENISCTIREGDVSEETGEEQNSSGELVLDETGNGKVEAAPPQPVLDGCYGGSRLGRLVGWTIALVSIWMAHNAIIE